MKSLPKIALLATVSSLALAGTASAAVTGLEINTTKSEFNSLFAKLERPKCSPGKQVLGGGARIFNGQGQVTIDGVTPNDLDPRGTLIEAREDQDGLASDWNVRAFAVCADPLPGYQVVSGESPATSSDKGVAVNCPSGKKLVGLGARLLGTSGRASITQLRPSSNLQGMRVDAAEIGAGFPSTWTVQGFAVCANPPQGLVLRSAASPFDSVDSKSSSAACFPGEQALGGGGEIAGSLGRVALKELSPTNSAITVAAEESQDHAANNWIVRSHVICAAA